MFKITFSPAPRQSLSGARFRPRNTKPCPLGTGLRHPLLCTPLLQILPYRLQSVFEMGTEINPESLAPKITVRERNIPLNRESISVLGDLNPGRTIPVWPPKTDRTQHETPGQDCRQYSS